MLHLGPTGWHLSESLSSACTYLTSLSAELITAEPIQGWVQRRPASFESCLFWKGLQELHVEIHINELALGSRRCRVVS